MFSPIQVNRRTIKNRLVMAPMGNCQMAEETGRPNDKMREYFFARAEGGVGLLTTGLIPISHHIDSSVTEKGNFSYFPRIDNTRTNFMGWRDLAQGVHARNSRIFIPVSYTHLDVYKRQVGIPSRMVLRERVMSVTLRACARRPG